MRYNKIRRMDISNGTGIRVSIFAQGCHFHCRGCFNPETWDFEGGKFFTTDTMSKLIELCDDDKIKGLSILGGEPLCDENFEEIKNICITFKNKFKDTNKDLWLWTGYEIEDILNDPQKSDILDYIDYIICGSFIKKQRNLNLKWRGSENQRVVDVKESLKQNKTILLEEN